MMIPPRERKPRQKRITGFLIRQLFLMLLATASMQAQVTLSDWTQIQVPPELTGNQFSPMRMAVNSFGDLYLLDEERSLIARLPADGDNVRIAGGWGETDELFTSGSDLTAAPGLDVLIVDSDTHRLLKFDRQLNFLEELNLLSTDRPVEFPSAVVRNHAGEVLVASDSEADLTLMNMRGTVISVMGGENYGTDRFVDINSVAINSINEIGLIDSDDRYLVLSRNGRMLWRGSLNMELKFIESTGNEWLVGTAKGEFFIVGQDSQAEVLQESLTQWTVSDMAVGNDTVYILEEGSGHIFQAQLRYAE